MRTKHVIVLPYDISWKLNFEKIKEELLKMLGDKDTVLGIEHVGRRECYLYVKVINI